MPGPRQRFVTSVFVIAILAFGSHAFGNPTPLPQRRSQQSKPEPTPVKKGKKGLASNTKKPESTKPASKPPSKPSSTTTASAVKPTTVAPATVTPTTVKPATVTTTIAPPPPSTTLAPARAAETRRHQSQHQKIKLTLSSIEHRRSHRLQRLPA